MIILDPSNHETANKVWREKLNCKPNGARTLGAAASKYLSPIFEQDYDMFVTYAVDIPFDIPDGVKKIAVMWHQNYPWQSGIAVWRKANYTLRDYDVDYFCNEKQIVQLIREGGGSAYFLPRFIDTTVMPTPNKKKTIPNLWFGNRWNEFGGEFARYTMEVKPAYWLSHNIFGKDDKQIVELDGDDALTIVNEARDVWAIGISQLEAQYLGARVHSYRGEVLPFYDQNTIPLYLEKLLQTVVRKSPKS